MEEKKILVSIFDPARGVYFESSLETAKKFIASAEELKKKIAKLETPIKIEIKK